MEIQRDQIAHVSVHKARQSAGLLGLYGPGPFHGVPAPMAHWALPSICKGSAVGLTRRALGWCPTLPTSDVTYSLTVQFLCIFTGEISSAAFHKAYSPISVFWIAALPCDYVATESYKKLFKQQGQNKTCAIGKKTLIGNPGYDLTISVLGVIVEILTMSLIEGGTADWLL